MHELEFSEGLTAADKFKAMVAIMLVVAMLVLFFTAGWTVSAWIMEMDQKPCQRSSK